MTTKIRLALAALALLAVPAAADAGWIVRRGPAVVVRPAVVVTRPVVVVRPAAVYRPAVVVRPAFAPVIYR